MKGFWHRLDQTYLKVAGYAGSALLITGMVGYILFALFPSFRIVFKMFSAVLKPLVLGLVLSYLLYPAVSKMEEGIRKVTGRHKWTRGAAVCTIFVTLLAVFFILAFLLIGIITHQIKKIHISELMHVLENLQTDFESLAKKATEALNRAGFHLPDIGNSVGSFLKNTARVASTCFFGIIFSIYFLLDGKNIGNYWGNALQKLCSPETRRFLKELASDADRCFSGYIRGQAVDALLVGILAMLSLTAIGMPYGVLIGIITGIGNLIPYIGPVLGYAMVALVNVLYWDFNTLMLGLFVIAGIMFVDGNVINPRLLAGTIHIHPLLVIVSLLAGGALGGFLGMLIAVPCGALFKLRFDRFLEKTSSKEA